MTSVTLRLTVHLHGSKEQRPFSKCFQDQQISQKKLVYFTFRLRRLVVGVCVHAWKRKRSQEAWNFRSQRPNWSNKLWNSQGALPQEKIRQERKIEKERISVFFTCVKLAVLWKTLKGLQQHQLPTWNHSVTVYMLPSLWFLHWKVFFSPLSTWPSSFSHWLHRVLFPLLFPPLCLGYLPVYILTFVLLRIESWSRVFMDARLCCVMYMYFCFSESLFNYINSDRSQSNYNIY